jgi:hypothetical protein
MSQFKKTDDLAVKVGEFQQDGETKGRYENVGHILSDGDREMYMIKRTFNPAGVPNPDGRDTVLLSRFAVRAKEQSRTPAKPAARGGEFSDEIPF